MKLKHIFLLILFVTLAFSSGQVFSATSGSSGGAQGSACGGSTTISGQFKFCVTNGIATFSWTHPGSLVVMPDFCEVAPSFTQIRYLSPFISGFNQSVSFPVPFPSAPGTYSYSGSCFNSFDGGVTRQGVGQQPSLIISIVIDVIPPPSSSTRVDVTETPCTGGSWSVAPGGYWGTPMYFPNPGSYNLSVVSPPPGATVSSIVSSDGGTSLVTDVGQTNGSYTITYNCAPPTSTIRVFENGATGGTWHINPGGFTRPLNVVTPDPTIGTQYTIVSDSAPAGFVLSSYDADGILGQNNMHLSVGEYKPFTINYSPIVTPFNYSLSAPNVTIYQTQSGQSVVTETYISGTAQGVNISASGLPSGVGVSYANQGCTPNCTATLTFTVGGSVTPGTYPITITGTSVSTGVVRTTTMSLVVVTPPSATVTVTPSPSVGAVVGQTITWTAVVNGGIPPCTNYAWTGTDIPSKSTGAINNIMFTYQTTGTKNVTATVTCSGLIYSGTGTLQMSVNPRIKEF